MNNKTETKPEETLHAEFIIEEVKRLEKIGRIRKEIEATEREIKRLERERERNDLFFNVGMAALLTIQTLSLLWFPSIFIGVSFGFTLGMWVANFIHKMFRINWRDLNKMEVINNGN